MFGVNKYSEIFSNIKSAHKNECHKNRCLRIFFGHDIVITNKSFNYELYYLSYFLSQKMSIEIYLHKLF